MRVELVGDRVEVNMGYGTIHVLCRESALKLADWIIELCRPTPLEDSQTGKRNAAYGETDSRWCVRCQKTVYGHHACLDDTAGR